MNLDFLRPLYERSGPYASVCFDASHDTADALSTRDLRWRALRGDLASQGVADETMTALDDAVDRLEGHPGKWGAALFASYGGDVHVETLARPPLNSFAAFSPLPQVGEVIRAHVNDVRWMHVLVDRAGGDIVTSDREAGTIAGSEPWPLHKSGKGGWSQPRYERSVEEAWDRNAAEVVEQAVMTFDRTRPDLVILAGDPDAVQLAAKRMPERMHTTLALAPGSRSAGADNQTLADATDIASVELVERRRQRALDRYHSYAEHGLAADGLADVALALRSRAVETLFLNAPDRDDDLWVSVKGLQASVDRAELGAGAVRENAGAALIASAAVGDADLVVDVANRGRWRDGVGASLRYPLAG